MTTLVLHRLRAIRLLVEQLGPYALIEILLPGGTLVALLLYLCRQVRQAAAEERRSARAVLLERLADALRSLVDRLPLERAPASSAGRATWDGLEPLAMAPA